MRVWPLAAALLCAGARLATPATPPPEASPTPPSPAPAATGLAAAAFMEGHWIGTQDGGLSEEVWSAPAGDSMLGMWRFVVGGRARVFELLAIGTDPEAGLVLRLRHFDGRLVAREPQDRPLVLRLRSSAAGEVSFEGPGPDGPLRLAYRREGAEGLVAVLERGARRDEFRYRRKASAAP